MERGAFLRASRTFHATGAVLGRNTGAHMATPARPTSWTLQPSLSAVARHLRVVGEEMKPCATPDEFIRGPERRWLPLQNGLIWCHSATLFGFAVWGRPGLAETRAFISVFERCQRHLAAGFDLVQDARGVESIDTLALHELLEWLRRNAPVMREHVRHRIAMLPPGVPGLALAGIQSVLGLDSPLTIAGDTREGFRHLLPDGGSDLYEEVEALIHRARGVTPLVLAVRAVLAETRGAVDLIGVAKRIGISARSLQRQLAQAGVSFRAEHAISRFRAAEELLRGDDKLAAVAAQLGLSEAGLTQLTRAQAGVTPGELRRRLRGD